VADPLSDQVWDMWTTNATTNTKMFRHLFRADPDDHSKHSSCVAMFPRPLAANTAVSVKTFDDYQNFLPKNNIKQGHLHDPFMPVKEVREKLDQIKGHLVWMPLDFLKDANMAEKGLQMNQYTESIYT
jgi:phospholipase D1/2